MLSDGDRDGGAGDQAPGPDILDGGAGADELSYSGRTRGLTVDLADRDLDGARNERDVVRGIESLIGGKGDDRLLGDRSGNVP